MTVCERQRESERGKELWMKRKNTKQTNDKTIIHYTVYNYIPSQYGCMIKKNIAKTNCLYWCVHIGSISRPPAPHLGWFIFLTKRRKTTHTHTHILQKVKLDFHSTFIQVIQSHPCLWKTWKTKGEWGFRPDSAQQPVLKHQTSIQTPLSKWPNFFNIPFCCGVFVWSGRKQWDPVFADVKSERKMAIPCLFFASSKDETAKWNKQKNRCVCVGARNRKPRCSKRANDTTQKENSLSGGE